MEEISKDTDGDSLVVDVHESIRVANGYSRRGSWLEQVDSRSSNRMAEQRRTRDRFNFYNIRPPANQQQYQPYNPYYSYDDSEDLYEPPNYLRPPSPRPPYQPYSYPPPPYPYPPLPPSSTTTTTAVPPSNQPPNAPIGYMLIDTYTSKFGSYSRPTAFFMNS